jgi:hypothetical protein
VSSARTLAAASCCSPHPSQPVGNHAQLLAGIDVRGDGGYIVVPPSTYACGPAVFLVQWYLQGNRKVRR